MNIEMKRLFVKFEEGAVGKPEILTNLLQVAALRDSFVAQPIRKRLNTLLTTAVAKICSKEIHDQSHQVEATEIAKAIQDERIICSIRLELGTESNKLLVELISQALDHLFKNRFFEGEGNIKQNMWDEF